MRNLFKRLQGQKGASLVEYALVVSLLALPSVSVMQLISEQMTVHFTALETNVSSSGYHSTATEAPGPTPTTTTPPPTTTTTTTPPPTTTSTTSTTTTTTTTTTTPPPTTTTTTAAPADQAQSISTSAGSFTFEVVDGDIVLSDYTLNYGWGGSYYYESDGDMVLTLNRYWGGSVTIKAWLDTDGILHVASW
jgi:Flp pilus assembly pilin Flp